MSEKIRVFVLAKTEPCFSHKYLETVCTAGVMKDGTLVRLYPIRGRLLSDDKKYHKYQWIECEVDQAVSRDRRPESRKVDHSSIVPGDRLDHNNSCKRWRMRRDFLLDGKIPVRTSKVEICRGARDNSFSLCLFKPKCVLSFTAKFTSESYTKEELEIIKAHRDQDLLFSFNDEKSPISLRFSKVPYDFHCALLDENGDKMELTVLDWEITSLFRNARRKGAGNEEAKESVLQKYRRYQEERDLYFMLGTRNKDHAILVNSGSEKMNPWSIISVMPFLKDPQGSLALQF